MKVLFYVARQPSKTMQIRSGHHHTRIDIVVFNQDNDCSLIMFIHIHTDNMYTALHTSAHVCVCSKEKKFVNPTVIALYIGSD